MGAPKKGDKVRVSYEATWDEDQAGVTVIGWVLADGETCRVPRRATVEVLASPVYLNHETTEIQPGDVVAADGGDFIYSAWRDSAGALYFTAIAWDGELCGNFPRRSLPDRLRLLIRSRMAVLP